MSLQINAPKITRVLLDDGWHQASGFWIDSYEFGAYYLDHERGQQGSARFDCAHGGGQGGVWRPASPSPTPGQARKSAGR